MGDDTTFDRSSTAAGAAAVVEGLWTVAAVFAELPAVASRSLDPDDQGRAAELLVRGWDLAAFTPTGALVLAVLDAAGARIELVGGVPAGWGRARRRAAASGAPPGRRVTAMAMVPGPDGDLLRASCGLVLRLPVAAVDDPVRVAWMLAWHAAMHAVERRALPAEGRLAAALAAVEVTLGVPAAVVGNVSWADSVAGRVIDELGVAPAGDAPIVDTK